MRRGGRFTAGAAWLAFVLAGACALSARAGDRLELTVYGDEDGLSCRWHGEWAYQPVEGWRLALAASLPQPVTNEDPAWFDLEAVHSGEDWRWSGGFGYEQGASTPGTIRLNLGTMYNRADWRISASAAREWETAGPDGRLSLTGAVYYRPGRSWRLSCRQEYEEVTSAGGANQYRRYAAEAGAAWRIHGYSLELLCGGSSHQDEDPLQDERTLFAELGGHRGLQGGWDLGAEARWSRSEKPLLAEETLRLGASLAHKAPVGLRFQLSTELDGAGTEWRAGLTVTGRSGAWSWRAGAAGELAGGDSLAAWPFAVITWKSKAWELGLGLTPEGEYAANSRQGYWARVVYLF